MKIQVISYNNALNNTFSDYEITYSSLNSPCSFDEFDINILSLQDAGIWRYQEDSTSTIAVINDFDSIGTIVKNSKKSIIIFCYPQNIRFHYCYKYKNCEKSKELKDMIDNVESIIQNVLPFKAVGKYNLIYENTRTIINNVEYRAAFYFYKQQDHVKTKTKSEGSNKRTTIFLDDNLYATTLDLSTPSFNLKDYLTAIGLDGNTIEIPQWLSDLSWFDDADCKSAILKKREQIALLNSEILNSQNKLKENTKYKRILIETGNPLAEIIFEMLEQMLDCDLSDFEDKKREDFRIVKNGVTFVGEIKGLNSNIRSSNVMQAEQHAKLYAESLEDEGKSAENIKPILIVNNMRTLPINERKEIHEDQKHMAETRGILIVTTETLLYLFEKYKLGNINQQEIISLFTSKVGVLNKTDF